VRRIEARGDITQDDSVPRRREGGEILLSSHAA